MEKLGISLNELSPLICLLIEKIQFLDSPILTKQQKLVCSKELLRAVDNLRMFFKDAIDSSNFQNKQIFIEKIERAFSQFEWNSNVAVTPYEFNKFSENGKLLLSSLLKLLGTKGCGVLMIETYIKLCLKTISEMTENAENKNLTVDKSNFKLLLEGFSSTANILKKYWHISLLPNQKNNIMLCLHQICKILPNLLKMIQIQCTYVKKYLLDLLKKCLTKIQEEIHNDGAKKLNHGLEFLAIMDFCLYKLNEISNYTKDFPSFIETAKNSVIAMTPAIDELLCTAMTIAQVTSFNDDKSAILDSCQKVIKELSELKKEIEEENGSAIKLNANSVGESLCNMEQKVNNAVLKLVLEVFSSVNSPLKNILNKCTTDIAKDNKASEDLNILILEFDTEMDKIMQIGFFAVSCTTNINRILKIQSCLASLESLEIELIPSLTALYVNSNTSNRTTFQCLFDLWLSEMSELKVLIDSVLDPAGFCAVAKNQVKNLFLTFKEDSSPTGICVNKLKTSLKQAIRYSKKLLRTLKKSLEDDKEVSTKTTLEYIQKFHLAVQECDTALEFLEGGEDTIKVINQAIKRFDFLLQTLDKLSTHLFILASEEETICEEKENVTELASFSNMCIPQKDYYKLVEISDIGNTIESKSTEILTPYVNKAILRSKKRGTLYTSPSKTTKCEDYFNNTVLQTRNWDKTPISSKRSRCCKPLTINLELENTIDLEITTILENISKLSTSFFKSSQESIEVQTESERKHQINTAEVSCGMEKDTNDTKPTYSSSGCCTTFHLEEKEETNDSEDTTKFLGCKLRNDFLQALKDLSQKDSLLAANDTETPSCVDSPARINDLKVVEEKINFLKTRMPFGPF